VNWNEYAKCYDLLCDLSRIGRLSLPSDASILDLGGGTGNFLCHGLPAELHRANLSHLDFNEGMLGAAREKYKKEGLSVELLHADATRYELPPSSFDCILSVNSLYAMSNPVSVLQKVYSALRPGGLLFLVNLGRIQNTLDWTLYLVATNLIRLGPRRVIELLRNEGSTIAKANRRIACEQRHHRYWKHTTAEIGEQLTRIGFRVDELRPCYRGYSDLAICTKPGPSAQCLGLQSTQLLLSPLRSYSHPRSVYRD